MEARALTVIVVDYVIINLQIKRRKRMLMVGLRNGYYVAADPILVLIAHFFLNWETSQKTTKDIYA